MASGQGDQWVDVDLGDVTLLPPYASITATTSRAGTDTTAASTGLGIDARSG